MITSLQRFLIQDYTEFMKKKILVVEDMPDAIMIIEATLNKSYDLSVAKNLVQARRELTSNKFDAILLDGSLPDGDGFVFCSWLLGDQRHQKTPIIFLTARTEPEEQEHALKLGATAYITKPIKPLFLRETLQNILD